MATGFHSCSSVEYSFRTTLHTKYSITRLLTLDEDHISAWFINTMRILLASGSNSAGHVAHYSFLPNEMLLFVPRSCASPLTSHIKDGGVNAGSGDSIPFTPRASLVLLPPLLAALARFRPRRLRLFLLRPSAEGSPLGRTSAVDARRSANSAAVSEGFQVVCFREEPGTTIYLWP